MNLPTKGPWNPCLAKGSRCQAGRFLLSIVLLLEMVLHSVGAQTVPCNSLLQSGANLSAVFSATFNNNGYETPTQHDMSAALCQAAQKLSLGQSTCTIKSCLFTTTGFDCEKYEYLGSTTVAFDDLSEVALDSVLVISSPMHRPGFTAISSNELPVLRDCKSLNDVKDLTDLVYDLQETIYSTAAWQYSPMICVAKTRGATIDCSRDCSADPDVLVKYFQSRTYPSGVGQVGLELYLYPIDYCNPCGTVRTLSPLKVLFFNCKKKKTACRSLRAFADAYQVPSDL